MSEQFLGEIILYHSDDGLTHIDVRFEGDTIWLTQAQIIELYHSSKSNICEHIKHIFEDGELSEAATKVLPMSRTIEFNTLENSNQSW